MHWLARVVRRNPAASFFLVVFLISWGGGLMSGLRVLIAWAAVRTRSLLIAQLIHISSTGSLVMFGPPHVSPAKEALWCGTYAALLWIVAGILLFHHREKA